MLEIQENVHLAQYTTLKVGGVADYLAIVKSEEELKEALLFAREHTKVPPFILGGGSNVLIPDEGYRGMVILISIMGREYSDLDDTSCRLRLGAGEVFDEVVADTISLELWGLENLSAIPGSVGATPVQNVGAYGVEVSTLIESVEAIQNETHMKKIFYNTECDFSYRNSFFKTSEGKQWVITAVTFVLARVPSPQLHYVDLVPLQAEADLTPAKIREAIQTIRSRKFPNWLEVGTAGSFFKNPIISETQFNELKQRYPELPGHVQASGEIKVSLGWILDKVCGLKGYCEGNVCLFEKQALVLVTEKNATATEIKNFSREVQKNVFGKTNIHIEPEVLFV